MVVGFISRPAVRRDRRCRTSFLRATPFCAADVTSLITRPSTARFNSIWTVTSNFIPFVVATMSPNPTVANTVTVK